MGLLDIPGAREVPGPDGSVPYVEIPDDAMLRVVDLYIALGRFIDADRYLKQLCGLRRLSPAGQASAAVFEERLRPGLELERRHGPGSQITDHPFNKRLQDRLDIWIFLEAYRRTDVG